MLLKTLKKHCVLFVFRAVSVLPNRIIGTVGEHRGFPVEALSLSHCGQWLASCSHDQLVKFSDVREVLTQKVDGHKRLKRTNQRKVLSSKAAAELDFFGDLDPDRGESSQQPAAGDGSSAEDSDTDNDSSDSKLDDPAGLSRESRGEGVGNTVADGADEDSDDDDIESDEDEDSTDDDDDDDD